MAPISPNKRRLLQLALGLLLVVAFLLVLYLILKAAMPDILEIIEHGDEDEIINYVRSAGSARGAILIALFQIIQVFVIVFPGAPIQIAAGIVYGALAGFLICYAAGFLAHFLVFNFAGKIGDTMQKWVSAERSKQRLRFITESRYPQFMIAIAYLVPLLPNGIIPYVASKTPVTRRQFMAAQLIGSAPSVFVSCYAGNKILAGDFGFAAAAYGLMLVGTIVLFLLRNRLCALLFEREKYAKTR